MRTRFFQVRRMNALDPSSRHRHMWANTTVSLYFRGVTLQLSWWHR